MPCPPHEEEQPLVPGKVEASWMESNPVESALRFLESSKLTMGQQCTLAAKKVNSLLGCTRLNITSRSYMVISLCSALVRQTWSTESSSELPSTRDLGKLPQVQRRSGRMTKGLQHLRYKESLRELGLFNLGKEKLWTTLSVCINICWGMIWKLKPVSSRRHPLQRQNTIGTNWNTWNSL